MEQKKTTISLNDIVVERKVVKSEANPTNKTVGQKIMREDTYNNPEEVDSPGADSM